MPKTFLKKSTGWTEIKSIFVKKTTGWAEVKSVFLKKTTGWVKVFTKANLPDTTTIPSIRTTNTGAGGLYDGPVATSPQFLNEDLFGKDGTYTNYTSKFGRKFTRASSASSSTRTTIVNDDRFTSAGGVTTAMRQACDEQYLFYELTVQNGSSSNEIYPISNAIKMIKSQPLSNSFSISGSTSVGSTLIANISTQYYYYNRPELNESYIKWYSGNYAGDISGTPVKTTSLSSAQVSTSSSTYTGTDSLLLDSSYLGKFITARIVVESSWTRHNSHNTSTYQIDYAYAGNATAVTGAIEFSNVQVYDYFGRNGLDNRDRWPTGTLNRYAGTLSGYDSNTVVRIRYRLYNSNTQLYWNPWTQTQESASNAWAAWSSDGSGIGTISSFSVNGTTATFFDYFDLSSSAFDGGGSPTWNLEIELSALKSGGTRVYYQYPYATYYVSKGLDSTISASLSTIQPGQTVTFSGSINGYPATPSTNGYPRQYRINFGDGTDSGWLPFGEYASGTVNPSYSVNKTYNSAGTYYASIETIPHYEYENAEVTVASFKTAPTITSVSATTEGAPVTAYFSGGSGPYYQIYWTSGTAPSVAVNPDASGSSSPITDSTGPGSTGITWYMYVRSVQTAGELSVGPSALASSWSSGYAFTVSSAQTAPSISSSSISPSSGTAGSTTFYASATASGVPTPTISYQWQYFSSSSFSYVDISGATSSSYTPPSNFNTIYPNYGFYCLITASNGVSPNAIARPTATLNSPVLNLTPPSIFYVAAGTAGGPVTAYFSGGSGPYYQIWWTTGVGGNSYDEYGYGSPITDNTGPSVANTTYYMYARSVSSLTNVGLGPSTTISEWSPGYAFTMSAPAVVTPAPTGLNINLSYSSGPSWTGSWSASGATSYSWSFYTADDSSGSNMTYRSGGSGTSMSYSGGSQLYGKLYVTATNSGGSISGESAWV